MVELYSVSLVRLPKRVRKTADKNRANIKNCTWYAFNGMPYN